VCTVGATISIYLIFVFVRERENKTKFEMVLNKKEGVIHMVNSSFFLTTCSFVKKEKY
jgi:hypothetical protein